MTDEEIDENVNKLLKLLDLEKCKDSQIGDSEKRGISGGEKKRLCIAIELVKKVEVIVLDEPTSGLDTFSAYLVMKILRDLANKGITVICTIHQPSSEIVTMFDNIILLTSGNCV